jgi:MFS transporter, FSR family, fosmidomycin resistance protein
MTSQAAAFGQIGKVGEVRAVGLVSAAHFVGHFHMMVVPPLFALLTVRWGVNFVQLGLALTVYALVSAATQLPMGWLADRFGSRKLLIGALVLGGLSLASIGLVDRYWWLLVAAGLSGIANAVYHPADYSILTARVKPSRIGRAFSVHTFAGMLGNALAPLTMLALVPRAGLPGALVAAGLVGPVVALPLMLSPMLEGDTIADTVRAGHRAASRPRRGSGVFTPAMIGMIVFFIVLSLSTSGLTNFSVPALMRGYHLPFAAANLALTAYLTATALGVLTGGFIADMTRRHGEVAAIGFAINAMLILVIALWGLSPALLVAVLGSAGFLSGIIQPSRDMLVRAAAPAGAIGRAFGVVTLGFSVGGTFGPMLFGWILDRGAAHWIFGVSVIFMLLTVAVALIGDRQMADRRAAAVQPAQ